MDASVQRIDAQRKLVHIRTFQLGTGAVIEYLTNDGMRVYDFQERFLVR